MTILERVTAEARGMFNMVFDREPLNYLEAAGLYGMICQGRYNVAALEVMYNHAQDPELKEMIREAMDHHTRGLVKDSEKVLSNNEAQMPKLGFSKRNLHKEPLDIPLDARMTDAEIAIGLGSMAKASQMALLAGIHQSYQPDVAVIYRRKLEEGLDWDYRLLQLMLNRGWLPHLAKIEH